MGRRTLLRKFQVLSDVDTTTDPQSNHTDVSGIDEITYELEVDPTVDSELSVEYCNDERVVPSSVFKPLNFNGSTPLVGATDVDYMIHIENKGFRWMRLSLANNAGTGNVNAWISGTVRGA